MIRLAVRCRPDQAEMVLAELTVLAPSGVEESSSDGFVEYAIYGAEGELPDIGEVEAASGDGLVEVVATEVADDWSERWRAFHKPLAITAPDGGTSFWLRPPWEKGGPGEFEVVIDPGQAFGTGAHPTTRLSLQLLLDLHDRGIGGGALTDLGTGSAVLAIAAAKLGWGPVAGYDHEEAAIEAAIENAEVNSVEIALDRLDLKAGLPELAPTVVANLTAPLLEVVASQLTPESRPGRLVCSGLLEPERERVATAVAPHGVI
ncbi:MAG: 50S ribosomal protein L11 methyltransferase, partial [Solirubrobacterales bacterium]